MDNAPAVKPLVILFDVNETLLDMTPLKKKVNNLLNSKRGFNIWFTMLLQYSLVDNSTHQYHDFSAIGNATLDMAAKSLNKEVIDYDKKEALAMIKQLGAYSDVEEGLRLLKDAGLRLATLTNSPMQTLTAQLEHAGITEYFETFKTTQLNSFTGNTKNHFLADCHQGDCKSSGARMAFKIG